MCIPTEAIAYYYIACMKIKNIFYSSALTKYELDNTENYRIKMIFQKSKSGEGNLFLSSGFGDHSGEVSQEPL